MNTEGIKPAYSTLYSKLGTAMKRTSTLNILLVEDEPADIYLIQRAIIDCCPQCRLWLVNQW
jgi:hypothetical protein